MVAPASVGPSARPLGHPPRTSRLWSSTVWSTLLRTPSARGSSASGPVENAGTCSGPLWGHTLFAMANDLRVRERRRVGQTADDQGKRLTEIFWGVKRVAVSRGGTSATCLQREMPVPTSPPNNYVRTCGTWLRRNVLLHARRQDYPPYRPTRRVNRCA
jgi:hypothetical protein